MADGGDAVRGKRRYWRACAIGGAGGLLVFLRVLWLNGGVAAGSLFGGFYETQAHAFRQLRWNIPNGSLGIEAFLINGKQYEYYGPWPAVLRMPLMFLFPSMNGRWTGPFMLLALVIALVAASRLSWRIRTLVRADAPVTNLESFVVGLFTFVLAAGSVLLFLASQVWVYHEAEIWGCALALASFDCLTAYILQPRRSTLVWTSLFATLAINSRASTGFGAVLAIVVLGGVSLFRWSRRLAGLPAFWEERRRVWLSTGIAAAVPVVTYMYVNYSKFHSLFVFPSDKQIFSQLDVYRKAMLARNDNSLFGFKFFPTALLQYIRPDALHFQSLVPFVNFPRTAHVIGNVLFDTIEPTSSVPSTMPIFFVLAAIGIVAIALAGFTRHRRAASSPEPVESEPVESESAPRQEVGSGGSVTARPGLEVLRIVAIGAIASGFTVVPYSYIGERYMSDFVPFLVIAGLAGLHLVLRWAQARQRATAIAASLMAVFALFSVWVNTGLAYAYHYESELVPEGVIGDHISDLYRWHKAFPGGAAPYVAHGTTLPPPMKRGTTFVVGNCDGVYWSQGNTWPPASKWYAVARTPASGQYDMRIRINKVNAPRLEPIIVRSDGNRVQTIAAYVTPHNRVQFGFFSNAHPDYPRFANPDSPESPSGAHGFLLGPGSPFVPGRSNTLLVTTDPNNGQVSVVFNGFIVFAYVDYRLTTPQLAHYVIPAKQVEIGTNSADTRTDKLFGGAMLLLDTPRPDICKNLSLPTDLQSAKAN